MRLRTVTDVIARQRVRYGFPDVDRLNPSSGYFAVLVGVAVGGAVAVLASIGYEHMLDSLNLYEWQRLGHPSPRTVPFVVGLVVVIAAASTSGLWVARFIRHQA
ncbi:MAG: hypothetical protein V3R84_08440 [Acidimicrobiia bacterium]